MTNTFNEQDRICPDCNNNVIWKEFFDGVHFYYCNKCGWRKEFVPHEHRAAQLHK